MLHFSSTIICGLAALRWAPAWPQQHRPRTAVRATEEELDRFFFDRAEVFTRGGPGGEGAVATQGSGRLPAGAMGGDGGSVYIECCAETNTLGHLHGRFHVRAERGADASGRRDGTRGGDATVRVPPHTLIIERATNATLGQLLIGERMLIAAGGAGGEGNGARYQRFGVDNKKVGPHGPWLGGPRLGPDVDPNPNLDHGPSPTSITALSLTLTLTRSGRPVPRTSSHSCSR